MKLKTLFTLIIAVFLVSSCASMTSVKSDSRVVSLDEYLIDFSKKVEGYKLKGGILPPGLDTDKFFAILDRYYAKKDMIEAVREYPVSVRAEVDDYVLILCDKDSKFMLLKDFGKTTDRVDYRYWAEGKQVPCK